MHRFCSSLSAGLDDSRAVVVSRCAPRLGCRWYCQELARLLDAARTEEFAVDPLGDIATVIQHLLRRYGEK